jgi:GNAT superfamily N-acetyltransferase
VILSRDLAIARRHRVGEDPVMARASAAENPRALSDRVAMALGGERRAREGVASYVSSRFDPFLNQVFVEADGQPDEAARRVAGRPAFVWMASEPSVEAQRCLESEGFVPSAFTAMQSYLDGGDVDEDATLAVVASESDVAAWHAVYSEVLGADPRSVADWQQLHRVLGPDGDGSLWLWVLRVEGAPAATAALFVAGRTAGLYCFATRDGFRRRGLATALIGACRRHARQHGATRCVLQASAAGRSVYAHAGFVDVERLPIFFRR